MDPGSIYGYMGGSCGSAAMGRGGKAALASTKSGRREGEPEGELRPAPIPPDTAAANDDDDDDDDDADDGAGEDEDP